VKKEKKIKNIQHKKIQRHCCRASRKQT